MASVGEAKVLEVDEVNPMGTDGFEFVEYTAPDPAALGALFESMGFTKVARHRSKDVSLYRQGDVNFIVNGEKESFAQGFARVHGPSVCAIAFRVKNAGAAYKRALSLGAWGVGPGPYLVLPLFGPSTVRDGVGLPFDLYASSTSRFIEEGAYLLTATKLVNTRAELLSTTKLLGEVSLDKYSFVRDAYLARRLDQVYDGAPPMEKFDDDPGEAPAAAPAAAPAPKR